MHLRNDAGGIDHTAAAVEPFVARAAERGVDEIGFTEHVYYFEQTRPFWPWPYYVERGSDEQYAELAEAVDESGVALEISTAGLRKPVAELYPEARLLQLSSAPVTLASDAHEPGLVGEDFDDAVAFARANGRETVSVFDGRVRRQEPIG